MTASTLPFPELSSARRRRVGLWLVVWAAMRLLTVLGRRVTLLTKLAS